MHSRFLKVISLLVVSMFLFTSFVGCGEKSTDSSSTSSNSVASQTSAEKSAAAPVEKKTLTIMVWGGGTESDEDKAKRKEFFDTFPELAAKINIEVVTAGPGDQDVANKIRLALSANDSPADICQLNYTQVPEFASADVLVDVSDAFAEYKDQILPGAMNLAQYKGKTIAFPFEVKPKLWFYRKDMFDAAGIDVTKVKNLDDFIAAGKQLQAKYPKSYIMNFGQTISGYDYMMVLSGTNCTFSDAQGNYILDTEPNVRKLLEAFKKLNDSGVIAPISEWTPDWEKAFSDGTLASSLCAAWLAVPIFLPKYAAGQEGKWACTQWPSFIGETGGSEAGGSVYVIPKFSKEPELAKEYLAKQNLSKEGRVLLFKQSSIFPINKEAVADPVVQAPNAFFGTSFVEETSKSIETLKVFDFSPSAAQEQSIIFPYFDKAVNGAITIDEALKQAQADLKNQIGNALTKK